jgi:hypothetical protein
MCEGVDTYRWLRIRDWWQALVNVVINLWVS